MDIFKEYDRIMLEEAKLRLTLLPDRHLNEKSFIPSNDIYGIVSQLSEVAKLCFVPRVYLDRYDINHDIQTHESVSAHTNLLRAILDRYLSYHYGSDFGEPEGEHQRTIDGFSYREIMEAVSLHDLPENVIGDIPDNGGYDKKDKSIKEAAYFSTFVTHYTSSETHFCQRVLELLYAMNHLSSPTGIALHLADKVAAVFMVLTYDMVGTMPLISYEDQRASNRDREEMRLCDNEYRGRYRASEMWTIDLIRIRKYVDLDETNFFLSVVVMYTLMVNNSWYNWREHDYDNA